MFTLTPTKRVAPFERAVSKPVVVEVHHGMWPQAFAFLWGSVPTVLSTTERTAIHLALSVRVYAALRFPTVQSTPTVARRGVLNVHQIRLRHPAQRPLMIVHVMKDMSQKVTALAVLVQPIHLKLRVSASLAQMDRTPFLVEVVVVVVEME